MGKKEGIFIEEAIASLLQWKRPLTFSFFATNVQMLCPFLRDESPYQGSFSLEMSEEYTKYL